MRSSEVAGIVFANEGDENLKKLTVNRLMASVPFGARYRLIDFTLSNLVNAGIINVGIITKEKYHSLMDHVGSGIHWELDRKNGGLYILPPYLLSGVRRYKGTVDALYGAMNYINHCKSEYIVLCCTNVLANIDVSKALEAHKATNADITVVYHNGPAPKNSGDTMFLTFNKNGRAKNIEFNAPNGSQVNFSAGMCIIRRDLLEKLVTDAYENDLTNFNKDVLANKIKQLKIIGFEHSEYTAFFDSMKSYYRINMDLLNSEVRHQIFKSERSVFTKTRGDMPTRYGTKSKVSNSLIADGCIIDGTVKNSILFRGVTVEKGASVENCILMQETKVGSGSVLCNVLSNKNAVIGDNMELKGTKQKQFFIKKNQII